MGSREILSDFFIIVIVASVLYPMRNIFGVLTRLSIYGLMAYAIFSDFAKEWGDKILFVLLLSVPIVINMIFRYLKTKMIKI